MGRVSKKKYIDTSCQVRVNKKLYTLLNELRVMYMARTGKPISMNRYTERLATTLRRDVKKIV